MGRSAVAEMTLMVEEGAAVRDCMTTSPAALARAMWAVRPRGSVRHSVDMEVATTSVAGLRRACGSASTEPIDFRWSAAWTAALRSALLGSASSRTC